MSITVNTANEACELVIKLMPNCILNKVRSDNAGYNIYSDMEGNSYSDLTGRYELNYSNGHTMNIWVIPEANSTGNIKSHDEIQKQIASVEQRIGWHKEDIDRLSTELSERIAKYKDDPMYIARWMASWLQPITDNEKTISGYYKELEILAWVIE